MIFRPDNWVLFDASEKIPLPDLPQLEMNEHDVSIEMPHPFAKNTIKLKN